MTARPAARIGTADGSAGRDRGGALSAMLSRAGRITVLTGAGLSTECGVPDFRSPGSPWRIHRPIDFQAFLADPVTRAEAWRRKFALDDTYAGARPGRGHAALVRLALAGRLVAVVTQNIDGLHQASGLASDLLVELHGNGTYARCLACGLRHELDELRPGFERTGVPPSCGCGGIVKSASVSFGQSLDPRALERACAAALGCDLFLVLGSSLVVRPASRLPALALARGATLVVVNREATPFDAAAALVVREDLGEVLAGVGADL